MREICTPGSVRGAARKGRPYRIDHPFSSAAPPLRHRLARVIGAHHQPDESAFKHDFLARFLRSVQISPLRERREDIPLLIRHIVLQRAQKFPELADRFVQKSEGGRLDIRISPRFVDYLIRHPLPKNVRELLAIVVKAIDESPGDELRMPGSTPSLAPPAAAPVPETLPPEAAAVEDAPEGYVPPGSPSKARVIAVLDHERGAIAKAARVLGLERNALYRLMRAYGIKRADIA